MKQSRTCLRGVLALLASLALALSLMGCMSQSSDDESSAADQATIEEESSAAEQTEDAEASEEAVEEEPAAPVAEPLTNTFTTTYGQVNAVDYPWFQFNYPDGWTVENECGKKNERVVLTSPSGIQLVYAQYVERNLNTNPRATSRDVTVTPVAASSFVPDEVQGTSYEDLGTFAVMEVTGDSQYPYYCVLPESEAGTLTIDGSREVGLSFWYSSHIGFVTFTDTAMTPDERQTVIDILSSFRFYEAPIVTP